MEQLLAKKPQALSSGHLSNSPPFSQPPSSQHPSPPPSPPPARLRDMERIPQTWFSPYYRLATREVAARPDEQSGDPPYLRLCDPLQGICVEIVNCTLTRKSQLTFAEQDMPVVFSLRLAGTGSISLQDRTQTLPQASRQLTVGYFPNCRGTVAFQPETTTLVNVLATRAAIRLFLPRCASSICNFLRIDEQEGYVLRTMAAPAGLIVAANQLLAPSSAPGTRSLFLCGAALEFLALAIDCLHKYLEHGHMIRLEKKDIATLARVRTYIETNIANPPSLEMLCRKFCLNSFKLKKGFKQVYGMTISGYIQYYRLNYAYNGLLQGETNVSESAWAVGYTNVSHFIAAFRRQFGFTPGECIRNHKEGLSSHQHTDQAQARSSKRE